MAFNTAAFLLGVFSSASLLSLMLVTVYSRSFCFWPPGSRNKRWVLYWILASLNTASITLMLLNQLSSFAITLNSAISLLAIFSGLAISAAAIKQLGLERTSGLEENLVKKGLYRYSRNPQVLGNLVTLFGVAAFLRTFQATLLVLTTGFWLIAMVFAEEKWLHDNYTEEYYSYHRKVPRFI